MSQCVSCGWRHVYENGDKCGVCMEGEALAAERADQ